MKIVGPTGSAGPNRATGRSQGVRGYGGTGAASAASAADSASVPGIPETELTLKVRQAIMTLMREVDTLRQELERAQSRLEQLEKLADQDPLLAPLANRRAFVRELSRIISYSDRYGTPSSLIYFDINGFKRFNDTFGHTAGDQALVHVGTTLTSHTRESDVVGRLGGDEFGVILANVNEYRANEKAQQLCDAIGRVPIDYDGQALHVTVAFGATTFRKGETVIEAMAAADRAMYEHKATLRKQAPANDVHPPAR